MRNPSPLTNAERNTYNRLAERASTAPGSLSPFDRGRLRALGERAVMRVAH